MLHNECDKAIIHETIWLSRTGRRRPAVGLRSDCGWPGGRRRPGACGCGRLGVEAMSVGWCLGGGSRVAGEAACRRPRCAGAAGYELGPPSRPQAAARRDQGAECRRGLLVRALTLTHGERRAERTGKEFSLHVLVLDRLG